MIFIDIYLFQIFGNRRLTSYQSFSFQVGRTTVSSIVKDICVELWNVLQPLYLATPTEEVWKQSEIGFKEH